MDYKLFKKKTAKMFADLGFQTPGDHFYKSVNDEILIVFGLQKSNYGEYCYCEFGYCLKQISKYLPYPKYNQLNVNCGRIMIGSESRLNYSYYEGSELPQNLIMILSDKATAAIQIANKGPDEIKEMYFVQRKYTFSYILGADTAFYFGMDPSEFKYHICLT